MGRQTGEGNNGAAMSLDAIAAELGCSQQRAGFLIDRAMRKFKAGLVARGVLKASDLLPDDELVLGDPHRDR